MSRVRILNLPNDCTEEQLKQHILRSAPPTAPPLDITDVMIKRTSPRTWSSHHHHHQQQYRHGSGGAAPSHDLGKIRMAFVGFQTSAAGHFVVQYFNNTYFRSAKMQVELAKGLNEVGITTNMVKKNQMAATTTSSFSSSATTTPAAAAAGGGEAQEATRHTGVGGNRKRLRDGSDGDTVLDEERKEEGKQPPLTTSSSSPFSSTAATDGNAAREHTRKELFIAERTKATEGPSWAAEVLLPHEPVVEVEASTHVPLSERPSTAASLNSGEHGKGVAVAVENEEEALARQEALGEVSDLDFLATLSSGGGGGGGTNGGGLTVNTASSNNKHTSETGGSRRTTAEVAEENEEEEGDGERGVPSLTGSPPSSSSTPTPSSAVERKDTAPNATTLKEEEEVQEEDVARESRRVRLGNIPYIATEEQVKQFAASLVGPVEEVHVPLTKDTKQSKGAAFVRFFRPEDAVRALSLCRGAILMGRLLRVSAAAEDPHSLKVMEREARLATTTTGDLAGSSEFKKRKELERRQSQLPTTTSGSSSSPTAAAGAAAVGGSGGSIAWNTLYMNSHAAVTAVSQRLGVSVEDVVGVQAKGAAVRAAIAEAYLTSEVQQVLGDEGISFDAVESGQHNLLKPRSNTTILVKNVHLSGPDDAVELSKMFTRFGTLETSAFPSAGSFALLRYTHPQDARVAFARLSYKPFKSSPLFLEWAPVGAIVEPDTANEAEQTAVSAAGGVKANTASHRTNETTGGGRATGRGGEVGSSSSSEAGDEKGEDDRGLASARQRTATKGDDGSGGHIEEEAEDGSGGVSRASTAVFTLFITNIAFTASEEELYAFLLDACPRLAKAPEQLIQRLAYQKDQGRAFLTVPDRATLAYCQPRINGKSFAGRVLSCVVSKQSALAMSTAAAATTSRAGDEVVAKRPKNEANASSAMEQTVKATRTGADNEDDDDEEGLSKVSAVIARPRGGISSSNSAGGGAGSGSATAGSRAPPGCDPVKLIVKNLPFEATEKDVRELFAAFAEVRSVRVPRKRNNFSTHRENNHRGFAFVEFMSEAEAARAMETLKATHLYGRHLVLQYAKLDE